MDRIHQSSPKGAYGLFGRCKQRPVQKKIFISVRTRHHANNTRQHHGPHLIFHQPIPFLPRHSKVQLIVFTDNQYTMGQANLGGAHVTPHHHATCRAHHEASCSVIASLIRSRPGMFPPGFGRIRGQSSYEDDTKHHQHSPPAPPSPRSPTCPTYFIGTTAHLRITAHQLRRKR